MADFQDKTLVCRDCGKDFVWTSGEQKFFSEKGFTNPPTRCPDDRKKNKEQRKSTRVMTTINCKKCGKQGEVPFLPKDPNDILCSDCFYEERAAQKGLADNTVTPPAPSEKPQSEPEETPADEPVNPE
ncbi:zinc-binding protein [Candidatus Berkelbacteria bacterium CG06_land_8_20_14_3_00_43_10]|uniref:Zinc-binding protein n=1 Tax=Candidatus Berkelbacteria bacterium CG10_big_fil_rev_8_21_14_0_10_43_14 TaxID=1974515 RepID=A0A2M6R9G0_9BACT|nr:MAG: zinc-binding protein [Candidatus Berkelbacteria bacterium CG10_big_fil_rev_8_21_14_0_10_43_14]PIU87431.1 MAG: zinc-binding protein [Candidatus Berkelbacteria bacterium CG06_land_8_20_14_3_00_43_10]